MDKRWVIKPKPTADAAQNLATQLGVSCIIAELLIQRGVHDFEEAKKFFRPNLEHLHNPFLMQDMHLAVQRIEQAIQNNENILVYGDYDVDGTTAVALMFTFLKSIHSKVAYYIPDRYTEGYGISYQGIDFARDNNFTLIIALDCGIKANDKITYANLKNIDFIICDHHRPGDELPAAIAVLDPKRTDCNYPFKELSGCGVGFKLVQAYAIKNNIPFSQIETFLDLVAISIASDLVPIVDENRTFAYFGLKQLNNNPRPGIKAMLQINNIKKELTINDIVFVIGPRINAAGRIENGKRAVELLITDTSEDALNFGKNLNITNTARKTLDTSITEQALNMLAENPALLDKTTTVLFNPEWHKGVVGIVASRLIETHYRPTIILTESNGRATGSARSVKDFDVYNAIEACSELLEQFGGHKYAAGLTLKTENIPAFQQKFEEVVAASIPKHLLIPEVEIDTAIELYDITPKFHRILQQFAPFGPENIAPVFITKNVKDTGHIKIVGLHHLKMELRNSKNDQPTFSAIAFGLANKFNILANQTTFSTCYSVEENIWNGNSTLQLNIKDIKI